MELTSIALPMFAMLAIGFLVGQCVGFLRGIRSAKHDSNQSRRRDTRSPNFNAAVYQAIACLEYYGDRDNWTPELYRYPDGWQDQYSYGWEASGSDAPWELPADAAAALQRVWENTSNHP